MSQSESTDAVAFVGAAGGAGTTRTVVEVAAALAADGRSVAVLDAAFATQGLAQYVPGAIDPDLTALLVDDGRALSAGVRPLELDSQVDGEVAVCPAYAPFERLARAKSVDAAQRFESLIASAASQFDHVICDVPPIASNQAVAAVNAAERVAVVAPATERGTETVQQTHERLADVGTDADLVVSTRGESETADVSIPETDATSVASAPTCLDGGDAFTEGIARVAAAVTGRSIEPSGERGGLLDSVGGLIGR
ncbi:AAA family ATPase [Halobellus rufus]|uniref:AAA family ATPase n=1 Tax=Halobellus rufus TaxID=1448860 RepID=UPI0006796A77|nr:AAA family ATPase [Halobellus rufus]